MQAPFTPQKLSMMNSHSDWFSGGGEGNEWVEEGRKKRRKKRKRRKGRRWRRNER